MFNFLSKNIQRFRDSNNTAMYYNQTRGGINSGGIFNALSGQGGSNDKSKANFYRPTLVTARTQLEVIKVESWAAKRFIYLPIDQMFIRPRIFEGVDEESVKAYERYLSFFELNQKLGDVMKAARLFGSAFMIFITNDARLDTPLNINDLQKGDLKNIVVFDRFSVTPHLHNIDVGAHNYLNPEIYTVYPHYGRAFNVHQSRVLRFDGQSPLTSDGWSTYDIYYGVSELIPVLESVYQEAQSAGGVSQLLAEVSVPIFKTSGFKDILGSVNAPDQPSLSDLANTVTQMKSIYNAIFMDVDDEMSRQEVSLTGVANVLNFFAYRLAAAAGIPATIFLGKSPLGMNATGDSDITINAASVASLQQAKLKPAYDFVDKIMTKTGGFNQTFTYEFPSLLDQSEKEQVDVALVKSEIVVSLSNNEIISVDEARAILDGDSVIGQLGEMQDDFKTELAQARQQKAQAFLEQKDKIGLRDKAKKMLTFWKNRHVS